MDLPGLITSAEKKYKKRLEEYFTDLFRSTNLISHGIDHHRRVWSYAKELLSQSDKINSIADNSLCDKLIIACYLHDAGMSVDPGPRHGQQSRLLCEQFLRKYNLTENVFIDVLDAIENHDNKKYSASDQPGEMMTILSVADDLDAFGFIGIFRYLEIYLTRGIDLKDIGHLIIDNVSGRYMNFVKIAGSDELFIEKHRVRYDTVYSFFKNYNNQLADYQFNIHNPAGFCGVAEIIQHMIRQNLIQTSLFSFVKKYQDDAIIRRYFIELRNELTPS